MAGSVDECLIDSHKLIYHPKRVTDWLAGKNIYPIYAEIALAGGCNQRCTFCAFDYTAYIKQFQNANLLVRDLIDMAFGGLEAVMFAGEGEPLLHPQVAEIIERIKAVGLDIAVTTNGSLLSPELAASILPHLSWLRVSINAATPKTYARVHQVSEGEFHKVMHNLVEAVKLKNHCTIGAQMVVLKENRSEVQILADLLASIGVDYLIVKPYSQHPKSIVRMNPEPLPEVHADGIKVIIRRNAEESLRTEKSYEHCLALPFWSYIDARGNVWGCSCFLGDERFYYGNINEETFNEIWSGKRRQESLKWVENEMDIGECRKACRLDRINEYLWQLKHQTVPHLNFI